MRDYIGLLTVWEGQSRRCENFRIERFLHNRDVERKRKMGLEVDGMCGGDRY
jgi:hypothetical protein